MFERLIAECRRAVIERETLHYKGATARYRFPGKIPPRIVVGPKGRVTSEPGDEDDLDVFTPPVPKKKGK